MRDLLDTLNDSLARSLRKAESDNDHDLAMICMDAQTKLAAIRLKRYQQKVYTMAAEAAEVKP